MITRKGHIPDLPWSYLMTDVINYTELDYCDDPRVFSGPDDTILIPSLRDRNLARVAFTEVSGGVWQVQGVYTGEADVLTADDHQAVLRSFDTMEEALYAVLGEPVEEIPDPDTIDSYTLIVEAGDDPIEVLFERDPRGSGAWIAHIPPPAGSYEYPAYFGGDTPLDALVLMFGLRPADGDGNYEYTPGL